MRVLVAFVLLTFCVALAEGKGKPAPRHKPNKAADAIAVPTSKEAAMDAITQTYEGCGTTLIDHGIALDDISVDLSGDALSFEWSTNHVCAVSGTDCMMNHRVRFRVMDLAADAITTTDMQASRDWPAVKLQCATGDCMQASHTGAQYADIIDKAESSIELPVCNDDRARRLVRELGNLRAMYPEPKA
jgi:hypothetical protein